MKRIILISTTLLAVVTLNTGFTQTPVFPPMNPFPNGQVPRYPMPMGQIPGQYPYPTNQPRQMPYPQAYPQPQMPPAAQPRAKPPYREFSGYLGIITDVIPASAKAQLPDGISQGILAKQFAPDSPAVSSDLKPYDVIVAYDNTPLSHPAQFIKLVRKDKPGRTVNLKVVRKGKILDVPVTLGSQKTPDPETYNGLAIKQLGKNKYEALLRFIGPDGNKQMRSYKGTRQEIFEQALEAYDLPPAEREQLLFATQPRKGGNKSGFGSFFPFGKNESGKDWMNPGRFFKW